MAPGRPNAAPMCEMKMRLISAGENLEQIRRCCVPSAQSKSHTSPPRRTASDCAARCGVDTVLLVPRKVTSIVSSGRARFS